MVAYQINALIYWPAEGRAENVLLEACYQHIPVDNADGSSTSPIIYRRGTYFLSDLVNDAGAYHLSNIRPIDTNTLLALYSRNFMEDVEVEFSDLHFTPHSKCQRVNHLSRKQKTTYRIHESNDSEASGSEEEAQVEKDVEELEKNAAKGASTAKALIDGFDEDDTEAIWNHQLMGQFHQLYWVPHPESNHMWSTRTGGKEWIMSPPGEQRNCPCIAINPKFMGKDAAVVLDVATS
ncbi:hypothetical protein BDR04DRAFT_1123605 [Suillus decipiens]|nr:hypothetical protein BDR04DRAFT_1123605 [Suillus decipiens]